MVRLIIIIFFLGLTALLEVGATHIRGGYIQAERVSTETFTYRIQVIGYTDNGSDIHFGGGILRIIGRVFRNFNVQTSDLGNGLTLNTFSVEYTFETPGLKCITYSEPNRSAAINASNSVDSPFFIDTVILINSEFGSISSIRLNGVPDMLGNSYEQYLYTPNFTKSNENDSLSFRLITPRQLIDSPLINYKRPSDLSFYEDFDLENQYKDSPPVFELDSLNGKLTWNSPGLSGAYIVAIYIESYRKVGSEFVFISGTTVDFEIRVIRKVLTAFSHLTPEIKIYPNPVGAHLNIRRNGKISKLHIIDVQGRTIIYKKVSTEPLDVSKLKPGIYFLQLESQGKLFTTKIFKD